VRELSLDDNGDDDDVDDDDELFRSKVFVAVLPFVNRALGCQKA
jgi:hypothetical protein